MNVFNKLAAITFVCYMLFSIQQVCIGQELYIHTEPASNIPKRVTGVKIRSAYYNQNGLSKEKYALRGMYGITAKWMVMLTGSLSNLQGTSLPYQLFEQVAGDAVPMKNYPYAWEGINLYTKYRLYSADETNAHLRIALFGEYNYGNTPYTEAEPTLDGSNSGVAAGTVITKLSGKMAVALTTGFIIPQWYREEKTGYAFKSGNALTYSLSAGYLLYPKTYTNYQQTNINLYLECIGKTYGKAKLQKEGLAVNNPAYAFNGATYVDVRPGIQFIFNSNLRLDLSASALKIGEREKKYTVLFLALQYYIIPGMGK
jgi:hypothetical protein